jgi:predicted site-specific integrase-resolvase
MAKKNKSKVPKTILGFKLSKGTRKDLKKLLKMFRNPDTHTIAMTAAGGLAAFLAERFAEHEVDKHGKRGKAQLAH